MESPTEERDAGVEFVHMFWPPEKGSNMTRLTVANTPALPAEEERDENETDKFCVDSTMSAGVTLNQRKTF